MIPVAAPPRTTSQPKPAGLFDGERQGGDRPALRRSALETSLFYDPPYESALDDNLARYLVAYLSPAASLVYKSRIWTPWTECRFDFLVDLGTRRVAIDYTDTPQNVRTALVEDNDALALGSGNVDVIFRIRQEDLLERAFDVLYLMAKWDPAMFTPYGRRVFADRASAEVLSVEPGAADELAMVHYRGSRTCDEMPSIDRSAAASSIESEMTGMVQGGELIVRRLDQEHPSHWNRQYERASLVYGMRWVMQKIQPPVAATSLPAGCRAI